MPVVARVASGVGTGVGPIAAATLLARLVTRFGSRPNPSLARWCGTGAVALSSGEGTGLPARHRLDFGGNRTVNSMLHIASVTRAGNQPRAQDYLARNASEGKTRREAGRAHKRHLANRVIRRMWRDEQRRKHQQPIAA